MYTVPKRFVMPNRLYDDFGAYTLSYMLEPSPHIHIGFLRGLDNLRRLTDQQLAQSFRKRPERLRYRR